MSTDPDLPGSGGEPAEEGEPAEGRAEAGDVAKPDDLVPRPDSAARPDEPAARVAPAQPARGVSGKAGAASGAAESGAAEDDDPAAFVLPDDLVDAYFGGSERVDFIKEMTTNATAVVGDNINEMTTNGTAVVGDNATAITILNGRGQARADVAPAPRVWERVDAYARVPAYDVLRRMLDERHVVGLTGPVGSGRFTTACAVLADRHADPGRVCEIILPSTHGADVREAMTRPDLPKPGHGHIVRLPDDSGPLLARVLEAGFAKCDATAILIADAGAHERELRYAEVAYTRPDPLDVFGQHLRHRLADRCVGRCGQCRSRCVASYVAECLSQQPVRDALRHTYRLAEIVDLAQAFAQQVPRGAEAVGAVLDIGQPARRARATEILLADPTTHVLGHQRDDQYQRAFRISYAAFDRQPLAYVFEATGMLLDEIDTEAGGQARGRPALDSGVTGLLGPQLRTDWDDGRAVTPRLGSSRVAWLRDRKMAPAILDVAWHDFDHTRPALLRWLDRLGADDREEVRTVGGVVAGLLTHHDFAQVHDLLLGRVS